MSNLHQIVSGTILLVAGVVANLYGPRFIEREYQEEKISQSTYHIRKERSNFIDGLVIGTGAGLLWGSFYTRKSRNSQ